MVDVVGRDLKDIPESKYTADHLYAKGITEYYSGRKESALDYFAQAAAFVGASDEIAAKALFAKAVSLRDAGRYAEELAGYDEIDRRFGNSPDLGAQREVASSLVNKGLGFVREGRKEDALAAYAEVVRRYGSSSDPAIQEKVAMALVNTGAHHGGEGRLEEALAAYEDVVHRFGGFDDRAVQERVALALFNKGIALEGAGRLQEGLAAYEEIDRRYGTSPDPGIREQVAMALVCRGRALGRKVSLRQAIAAYDEVDRRFGSATESGIQKLVVLALVNKGMALGNIGKDKDELAVFDEVERRFGVCSSPEVQRHVATARNGIGCDRLIQAKVLWKDVTQRTEALNSALEALDRALPHTTDKDMVLGNRAYTLFLLGRFEEARESMRQALLLGGKHRYTCEAEVAELTTVPEDADFLRFLADTWREVHGTEPPGFPGVGEAAPA
ncbi:hypothetical protein NNJEOMEG_00532 [Fundidesulfovibrio magnetotacticus]|uniref:Tetratricopeptide repeat protein n=1 Tax=Fundidesulfovibrio magnetotacticus TaxID=2730080 RepID=A0A6V8LSD7_9BACT|nr:hypothetical protein NNJEOMEG_00532 [Fundidesulfovibrio magnetotacticus]